MTFATFAVAAEEAAHKLSSTQKAELSHAWGVASGVYAIPLVERLHLAAEFVGLEEETSTLLAALGLLESAEEFGYAF